MTIRSHARPGGGGRRILDGAGLSVRRRPLDPGTPIDYTCLLGDAPTPSVTDEPGHAAGYEAGFAQGQRDARAAAKDAERDRDARVDRAISALCRSADAARAAYEDRSAQLQSAAPRFTFELLEALFAQEVSLTVDPGRQAVARALALDESTLPAVARLCPDDAATIGELGDLSPSRSVTVVADPTIEPGGAVVEIGSTTIDAQLSRALERVRAVIVGQAETDAR